MKLHEYYQSTSKAHAKVPQNLILLHHETWDHSVAMHGIIAWHAQEVHDLLVTRAATSSAISSASAKLNQDRGVCSRIGPHVLHKALEVGNPTQMLVLDPHMQ